jgi:F0F1-type ATP synthase membrane subunit b/b'
MAMQTQTIKERLQSVHDELKAAAAKHGEEANERIRNAVAHAEATRTELQARLKDEKAHNEERFKASLEHLDKATHQARAAMEARGAEAQEHLKKSIASAKAALED